MIEQLLEPFKYDYMVNALWVSTLVRIVVTVIIFNVKGVVINWRCFVSLCSARCCYSLYTRYSFSRSIYFRRFTAGTMLFLSERSGLKVDVIGLVFTAFFGFGLFIIDKSYVCFNSNNHNG